jgi:circadian clock protein KaiC
VHIDRSEIEETGEYNLEGLFVRLGYAIDSIGAKRVVLDTLEALFSGFTNQMILRSEIRRLFRWIKDRGSRRWSPPNAAAGTALTRHGLEEYVSDCVIVLDHRIKEQVSTRRLRVVKYRGSTHGTNEYPFLLEEGGISCCRSPRSGWTMRFRSAYPRGYPGWTHVRGQRVLPGQQRI